jgi:putative transcriptional regulator
VRTPHNDIILLGQRIRALREERGLTQAALAKQLGVSRPLVNAYETGKQAPRFCHLVKLHRVLGIPRGALLAA